MLPLGDPFDESVSDVRELIAKAKNIQESVRARGLVIRDVVEEVKSILNVADEELVLLKSALNVIEQRNGRIGDQIFSVKEVLRRQGIIRDLENEINSIHTFRSDIEAKFLEMEEKNRLLTSSTSNSANDEFLLTQEFTQKKEQIQQDVILDRLSYGLQELRETGINVNDELVQQDVLLDEAERDVEGVQARLRIVNAKVDKLLASMSNRKKICTLVTLILVLVFLLFVVAA